MAGKIGRPFPTSASEASDPSAADQIYGAGTRWLIEHTRDRAKFNLLPKAERNALGARSSLQPSSAMDRDASSVCRARQREHLIRVGAAQDLAELDIDLMAIT